MVVCRKAVDHKEIVEHFCVILAPYWLVCRTAAVVHQSVYIQQLAHFHPVAYGHHDVVVIIDAVVEYCTDNQILSRLGVIKVWVEACKRPLYCESHITGSAGKIDKIMLFFAQILDQCPANQFVGIFVLAFVQHYRINLIRVKFEQFDEKAHLVAVSFAGYEKYTIAFVIHLLYKEIERQRVFCVYDVDYRVVHWIGGL